MTIEHFITTLADEIAGEEKLAATDLTVLSDDELLFLAFGEKTSSGIGKDIGDGVHAMRAKFEDPTGDVVGNVGKKIKKTTAGRKLLRSLEKGVKILGLKTSAETASGNITYDGDVSNGEPSDPQWPRAAMGVDSAGRKATAAETSQQQDTATPQHTEPKTAGYFKAASRRLAKEHAKDLDNAGVHEKSLLRRSQESKGVQRGLYGTGGALAGFTAGGAAGDELGLPVKGQIALAGLGALTGGTAGVLGGDMKARVGERLYRGLDAVRGSRGVNPERSPSRRAMRLGPMKSKEKVSWALMPVGG